jgi:hypothetical protein
MSCVCTWTSASCTTTNLLFGHNFLECRRTCARCITFVRCWIFKLHTFYCINEIKNLLFNFGWFIPYFHIITNSTAFPVLAELAKVFNFTVRGFGELVPFQSTVSMSVNLPSAVFCFVTHSSRITQLLNIASLRPRPISREQFCTQVKNFWGQFLTTWFAPRGELGPQGWGVNLAPGVNTFYC